MMRVLIKSAHQVFMQICCICVLPLVLMACSGGETGTGFDVTQTNTSVTVGRITDFDEDGDSLYVNGIEFDTNDSSFLVDNESATEDDLKLGMVVEIEATISDDGLSGDAIHIKYQDVLEAFVDENQLDEDGTGVLIIAGQTINIDSLTVFDSQVDSINSVSDIQANNIIEVSGFTSGDGFVNASRIEVKAEEYIEGETIEIKGRVAASDADTFKIGALVVNYTSAMLVDFPVEGIANGQYIEVITNTGLNDAGEIMANTLTLLVSVPGQGNVPASDTFGSTPVNVEGLVTSIITAGEEFTLNGQTVIITNTTVFAARASAEDIVENQTMRVVGFINTQGIITARMIRLL